MTRAARLSLGYVHHRVLHSASFHTHEDIRVTQFASVPDGVFFVREDDVGHSLNLRVERKVFLHG